MRAAPERTAPGVGQLSIADSDVVEESNLQRQIIHKESSVGSSKAVSAASACMALNSRIRAAPLPSVTAANVAEMVDARPRRCRRPPQPGSPRRAGDPTDNDPPRTGDSARPHPGLH